MFEHLNNYDSYRQIYELAMGQLLEIRRGKRNNLGITFHITPLNVCCDLSLEPSRRDGSNEGSLHMFSLRNKKNYL